jgi:RNA 3'-terminal phosphate cyclase (GTP)
MIEIDGAYLEGGGQILRTAIAFSALTQEAVHIFNIRKGRDNPGLRPQHLHGIGTAGLICNAKIKGLKMKSTDVTFIPGKIKGGKYAIDTKTAGSVTLILQILVPIGLFADSPLLLVIRGGTAVPFSPTIGYFSYVFSSLLQTVGVDLEIEARRQGFYPKGGGEVMVRIQPSDLKPISMKDRGPVQRVKAWIFASRHLKAARVAERMLSGFSRVIQDAETEFSYVDAVSPGCFMTACAFCDNGVLGADALGKRGKPAENVGQEAAMDLEAAIDSQAAVDKWMADQLIPFMALATHLTGVTSEVSIPDLTNHAQTNIWVVQKFLKVAFTTENNVLRCIKSVR